MRRGLVLALGLLGAGGSGIACSADDGSSSAGERCVPGRQVSCPCSNGDQGTQICNDDAQSYGACECPGAGGTGGGGFPDAGTGASTSGGASSGGAGGTGGAATGGSGSGGSPVYTQADCLVSSNNGSEVCDDEGADVPTPVPALVLVCLNDNGGMTYISSNTGPQMSDGISRCQGWETSQPAQNAWDHLQYLFKLQCDQVQKVLDVDLTGQSHVYVGSHDYPTVGAGHNTPVCLALKK